MCSIGHDYDNKPGAWRERDNNDKGSQFKERSGFRDDSKDRDWNRYSDRGRSKDRDGDKSSSFGPRRNYGDSDWDRRQDTKRKRTIIQNMIHQQMFYF